MTELQQMHNFCLDYKSKVRAGETPNRGMDLEFIRCSGICYSTGIYKQERVK